VIGGEVAAEGAWPWQVALLVGGAPVSTDSQFCGGSRW
jgi:secreted trypsin-like serine protease